MEITDLKSALIIRILLVIPAVIIIGKICIQLFKNVGKDKKVNIDFDEMVRRKTEYFKFNREIDPPSLKGITLSNTEKVYTEFFNLPQNEKNPEKKRFLQVFRSLQWGESPLHLDIINYLKKSYSFNSDLIQVTKAINDLIKNDVLISPKWRNLPNFTDLEQVVALRVIFEIFLDEAKVWGKENLRSFCQREELDLKQTCKAIAYYFSPKDLPETFSDIVRNSPAEKNLINNFNLENLKKRIFERLIEQIEKGNTSSLFLKEISNLSILFESLKKIEPLQSKFDLAGARRIFDLNNGATLEEIKKRYKSLAKINHPDTLVSLELPEDILKMVNGNFSQIKHAYDLLVANELAK